MSGLLAFVQDLQRDWEHKTRVAEGRTDVSDDAVELVTMHSSKGLEWPVVIPINTGTRFRSPAEFVHRRSDDTLHWVLGGLAPPELDDARAEESAGEARQRERMWYVACTRARDILIVPHLPFADTQSWSRIMDLGQGRLPELDLSNLPETVPESVSPVRNAQSRDRFAEEAEKVAEASPPLKWRRPSDHDPDRAVVVEGPVSDFNETAEVAMPAGAGRLRGIFLHKLMEEFLTGELADEDTAVDERARVLLEQFDSADPNAPDAAEMASTALRSLRTPEIAKLRPLLVPELSVWSELDGDLIAGRADAVAIENGSVSVVLDWKSDVRPTPEDRAQYAGQLTAYKEAVGARRGAVVYMTLGELVWL